MNYHEIFRSIINKTSKCINFSFSQEGEDIIVDNLLNFKTKGFYIDIGALHPARFSNTMRFYHRGWWGLNIDATPGSMNLFNRLRPRDINIEAGVSQKGGGLDYYVFNEPALNTFDAEVAQRLINGGCYKLIDKIEIQTYTVMEILDKYIPENQKIDFMDIDIEGFDDEVINSIDWEKYHPYIILAEKPHAAQIVPHNVLVKAGYEMAAWTGRTVIYKASNWI